MRLAGGRFVDPGQIDGIVDIFVEDWMIASIVENGYNDEKDRASII